MELRDRVAFITGGGRGVGRACALELARRGARVAVVARTAAQVEAVAGEIERTGGRALGLPCDVAVREAVEVAVARVREVLGPVTILVYAAGVAESHPFREITDAVWERHLRTNVTGALYAMQAVLPDMLEVGWGRIVAVASVLAKVASRYTAAYATSKHALLGLVRSVALEYADRGITANAICPGYLQTDMTAENIRRISARTGRPPEEVRRALESSSPQRRLFTPEEVASLVAYLCTDAAGGINGQGIVLDGGGVLS
ncbi:MAG: SDR family NAD(P)-dependent oxidoreductase [Armatimonadota bacterium]|nr:SDR family NAD(P)-dependent oxidoreductase [Armatimonadota bacterium]MDR7443189.1 SDR family NAD(P)-dependent oxidoreductase [Armatimonadota bacterium]MDR7570851.1 SDR family NAD(P)-dependent oxidoreductase [Armatimonadota bacterium]MDR7614595.1 SDR family NAD(P)-dependent oxidoreductase [Armatimonadota bacterium]